MFEYQNNSIVLNLQMNAGVKPIGPEGKKENVSDEIQLERILARSDENVYINCSNFKGIVPGKCIIVQDLRFHSPWVLLIGKIITEEEAEIIKNTNDSDWRRFISQLRNISSTEITNNIEGK